MRLNKIFISCLIIFVVVFLTIPSTILNNCGELKGAYNRKFHTPAILKQKQFILLDNSNSAFEKRKTLLSAYQAKKGFYGISQKRRTIEGDAFMAYLAADNGKLVLIIDYTHDPRSIRAFRVENPLEISLVIERESGDYIEWQPDTADTNQVRIKCVNQSGGVNYF
jgi:hypothetical protein